MPDGMEVDSASGFMSRTLMVLKGKTSPETRLSTADLQVFYSSSMLQNLSRGYILCMIANLIILITYEKKVIQ